MVIEIASVNKIQPKSISTVADPRGVTGQKLEEIFLSVWQVKVKKNVERERHISKMFLIQNVCSFFTFWLLFFRSFKNNNIISNSSASTLTSAK